MRNVIRLSLVFVCLVGPSFVFAAPSDLGDAFLDRLETGCRRLGEPPPKSMTAIQTLKEMDGDGRAKSVTTVLKAVAFRDSTRVDSVLNATEKKRRKDHRRHAGVDQKGREGQGGTGEEEERKKETR